MMRRITPIIAFLGAFLIATAQANEAVLNAQNLVRNAEALASGGAGRLALSKLEAARPTIFEDGSAADQARYFGVLGEVRRRLGQLDEAETAFAACRVAADKSAQPALSAAATNGLALIAGARGEDAAGVALFDEAASTAEGAGLRLSAATALANGARLSRATDGARLTRAFDLLTTEDDTPDVSITLAAIGDIARQVDPALAERALQRALTAAGDHPRARSFALGLLGRLAEDQGDFLKARGLTTKALLTAAAIEAPDLDYLWLWQEGRLARRIGERDLAIEAYRGAIERSAQVRSAFLAGFTGGRSPFREALEPLFLEYLDILTAAAAETASPAEKQALIAAARNGVERLKAAELQDYFGDDCLAGLESKRRTLEGVASTSATVYPILLEDRLVIIVGLGETLEMVTVSVVRQKVIDQIRLLRSLSEKRTTRQYLRPARRLYDVLVRPLATLLDRASINTLVFVPDGSFRTVPFAALHDGDAHLIERYAVAVAPGLDLIDPRPINAASISPILLGVTEAQEGFSALPSVGAELANVASKIGGRILLNDAFTRASFKQEIAGAPYTIVHVASHGSFGRSADDSFLITNDGRLTLDELEAAIKFSRFREQPIELLTLSACRTAAGDDRAALGLAGVAIKSGARSALASLWNVNDESTGELTGVFYAHLFQLNTSKAEALRQAQLHLIRDRRTSHPAYWAPFLIIGNWL